MQTIGGFIQLDEFKGNAYHEEAKMFNLGRTALLYIVKLRGYKKVYLPYYLCECLKNCLEANGIRVERYHIDVNFYPLLGYPIGENASVLIVNYFGLLDDNKLLEFKERYGSIIVDNTHAFYRKPIFQTDTVYTCRKWFGVPDGAYAYLDADTHDAKEVSIDYSADRWCHILGKYERVNDDYYEIYRGLEEKYENERIKTMSSLTQNILKAVDYDNVKRRRIKNYELLHQNLKDINELVAYNREVPFMYPLYIKKAEILREKLKEHRIFTPLLWPEVLKLPKEWIEYELSQNIVVLPCDQRYGEQDMLRMICCIRENI